MNDARWLRLWCARHVRATSGDLADQSGRVGEKSRGCCRPRRVLGRRRAAGGGPRLAARLHSKRAAPACRLQSETHRHENAWHARRLRGCPPSALLQLGRSPAASPHSLTVNRALRACYRLRVRHAWRDAVQTGPGRQAMKHRERWIPALLASAGVVALAASGRLPRTPSWSRATIPTSSRPGALQRILAQQRNTNRAKNVILIVGDGMGFSTVTATRIFEGQQRGVDGEFNVLAWEAFPISPPRRPTPPTRRSPIPRPAPSR